MINLKEEPESMLDLAVSHVTQQTNGHIKTDWSVQLNKTDKEILTLPSTYLDNDIFKIMDFAKEYELIAFNKGIKLGKEKIMKVYKDKLDLAERRIEFMKAENEKLANALEQIYFKNNKEN